MSKPAYSTFSYIICPANSMLWANLLRAYVSSWPNIDHILLFAKRLSSAARPSIFFLLAMSFSTHSNSQHVVPMVELYGQA